MIFEHANEPTGQAARILLLLTYAVLAQRHGMVVDRTAGGRCSAH